jgi:hypothetical protein
LGRAQNSWKKFRETIPRSPLFRTLPRNSLKDGEGDGLRVEKIPHFRGEKIPETTHVFAKLCHGRPRWKTVGSIL